MRGLLFSRGEYWKFSRQILSPTFSTSKIKMVSNELASCYIVQLFASLKMLPLMSTSVATLVDMFSEGAALGKSIEVLR